MPASFVRLTAIITSTLTVTQYIDLYLDILILLSVIALVFFYLPSSHTIRITPYYLLGLIEGEGSFSLSNPKTMAISFYLSLTAAQSPLMNAIKNYLTSTLINNAHLKSLDSQDIINEVIFIYSRENRRVADKPQMEVSIKQIGFLVEKFIPMLSDLCFISKKYKDFQD